LAGQTRRQIVAGRPMPIAVATVARLEATS